jgi:putative peptide zinc metalloprotease protein
LRQLIDNKSQAADDQRESVELANLQLRLRNGLSFQLREHGGEASYVLHDETTGGYFQIGVPEYAFISVLDGKRCLQDAVQEISLRLGDDALTMREAIRVSHWLVESGLAQAATADGRLSHDNQTFLLEQLDQHAKQEIVSRLNPLFIKLPLGNPQPLLEKLNPTLGGIVSKQFAFVWIATILFGIYRISDSLPKLATAATGVLASGNWLWMLMTLVGLKVAHEISHGLFCIRMGGRVRETGLVFILFIPIPYVDVTSSWGFGSKWHRIAVACAGMYIEVFLAALATVLWSYAQDPVWQFHLFNVMLLGSLTTVLFNANFLMRFDGYYVLADWLAIPNLYQKGQQFVGRLGRQFLFGMNVQPDQETLRTRLVIAGYGIGAWLWRILICVSLSILATKLFYGFGVALALFGIAIWLGLPIVRSVKQWSDPSNGDRPNLKWMATVTAPAAIAFMLSILFLPWPVHVWAPGVVEYRSPSFVRAETSGFVTDVCVRAGQSVEAGDVLVILQNKELEARLRQLQLDQESSLIRSRGFHRQQEIASYQAENLNRSAIEDQIDVLKNRIAALKIIAKTAGVVLGDDIDALPGQFVSEGMELLQVVDESQKRIAFLVRQDEFESFASAAQGVFAPAFSRQRPIAEVETVQPTASSRADIRLTSYAGGSLPARPASNQPVQADTNDQSVELTAPRFVGQLNLKQADAVMLKTGMVGHVRLDRYHETIAEHIVTASNRWLDSMLGDAVQ